MKRGLWISLILIGWIVAIRGDFEIITTSVSNGVVGEDYYQELQGECKLVDCNNPCVWSIAEGILPPGLELDESNGVISGRPISTGVYGFTVRLSIPGCEWAGERQKSFEITICEMVVDFTSDIQTGQAPLTVRFSAQTGRETPLSVVWRFGDNQTSGELNPEHVYMSAGQYDVTLRAVFVCGQAEVVKRQYVTVTEPPALEVEFRGEPLSGCRPLSVQFTDLTGGAIATAWEWDFGDGQTAVDQNPLHDYQQSGIYDVELRVSNAVSTGQLKKNSYITVIGELVAGFSAAPLEGQAPLTVQFTDLTQGSPISGRLWEFGDGTRSEDPNPSHTYSQAGDYTVRLIAVNECGSYLETKPGYIRVTEPPVVTVDFSAVPNEGCPPLTVQFTDLTSGLPDAARLWDFGDGQTSSDPNPSHTYTDPGRYSVRLSLSLPSHWVGESYQPDLIWVYQTAYPEFRGNPLSGTVPLTVQFTDLTPEASDAPRLWDFGDGQSSNQTNPSHLYTQPGSYTVSLTVTDQCGSHLNTKPDYILAAARPAVTVDFSAVPTQGDAPLSVQFTDLTLEAPDAARLWDFGDGQSSNETNPSHLYTQPGSYTVSLTVTDDYGSYQNAKSNYIQVTAPPEVTVDFSATPTEGCLPLSVQFTDLTSGAPDAVRLWDFGDGANTGESNPSHLYQQVGSFTVRLFVYLPDGTREKSVSGLIRVHDHPRIVDLKAFPSSPRTGETVTFHLDWESPDPSPPEEPTIVWTIGSQTWTQPELSYTFADAGDYTVSAAIQNSCGQDTRQMTIQVLPVEPIQPIEPLPAALYLELIEPGLRQSTIPNLHAWFSQPHSHRRSIIPAVGTSLPSFRWNSNGNRYRLMIYRVDDRITSPDMIAFQHPIFEMDQLEGTEFFYPPSAPSLERNMLYAYRIEALDISQNQLRASEYSEMAFFKIDDDTTPDDSLSIVPTGPSPLQNFYSTVKGKLHYSFASEPYQTGEYIGWPLADMPVSLVVCYAFKLKSHTPGKPDPYSNYYILPEEDLPPGCDDNRQLLATDVTDSDGGFSFGFIQTDSMKLVLKDYHISHGAPEFPDLQIGDVYRVARIIVQHPCYASPPQDIVVQPGNSISGINAFCCARSYTLNVTLWADTVNALMQVTQGRLEGMDVYLLRAARPDGIPANEGQDLSNQTKLGMSVVAKATSDKDGRVVFRRLVRNYFFSDYYYIYAEPNPQIAIDYRLSKTPLHYSMPEDKTVFRDEYEAHYPIYYREFSAHPRPPSIAGVLRRQDTGKGVEGAEVTLWAILETSIPAVPYVSTQERFQYSSMGLGSAPKGYFGFLNLQPQYNDQGQASPVTRRLDIYKFGYHPLRIDNLPLMKLGEKWYRDPITLVPAHIVKGSVVDENGAGQAARVRIGEGLETDAKSTVFNLSSMQWGPAWYHSPAVNGHQVITVNPLDQSYLPATVSYYVTTADSQIIPPIVVYKKLHRVRVIVTRPPPVYIQIGGPKFKPEIQGAIVRIGEQTVTTGMDGIAELSFGGGDDFKIYIQGPPDQDYIGKVLTVHQQESSLFKTYPVELEPATRVSGYVRINHRQAVEGARVFFSSYGTQIPIETWSDAQGHYVLHNIPISSYPRTFKAVKSSDGDTTWIGSSRTKAISAGGNDTLNFNLEIYDGMDITRILGFPVEIDSLIDLGAKRVQINGALTKLPSNSVFAVSDPNQRVPFKDVRLIPGAPNAQGVPTAQPETIPVTTGINQLDIRAYDYYDGCLMDQVNGIQVNEVQAGENRGLIGGGVYLNQDAEFDTGLDFPDSRFYLALSGSVATQKMKIPCLSADGEAPTAVAGGLQVVSQLGGALDFNLYQQTLQADSNLSVIQGHTISLLSRLKMNLPNINPPLDIALGQVKIVDKKVQPVQGIQPISIKLEQWELTSQDWSLSGNGGMMLKSGILKTQAADIPFTMIQITPSGLVTVPQSFKLSSLSLKNVLTMTLNAQSVLGWVDSHWQLFFSPDPQSSQSHCGVISNLPGMAPADQIRVQSFYIRGNGDQSFGIDPASPAMNLYHIGVFRPNMMSCLNQAVQVSGSNDFGIPNAPGGTILLSCYRDAAQNLKLDVKPFTLGFSVNGVTFKAVGDSMVIGEDGLDLKAAVAEAGKFEFKVCLHRKPNDIRIDILPHQSLKISPDNSRYLKDVSGGMQVMNGNWNNFYFEGDLTGAEGATGRLGFTVVGEVTASEQEIKVDKVATPFGNVSLVYDFAKGRLTGCLSYDAGLGGGGKVSSNGDATLVIESKGWYFVAGAQMSFPSPIFHMQVATVFGDYPIAGETAITDIFSEYSFDGKLPDTFANDLEGFFFTGLVELPCPIIPTIDIDLLVVHGELIVSYGGMMSLGMNFAGPNNVYHVGQGGFVKLHIGLGASVVIACAGASLDFMYLIRGDGEYISDGTWWVQTEAGVTLTGSAYAGGGCCDSDCDWIQFCPCPCVSKKFSGSVYGGILLRLGQGGPKFEIVLDKQGSED